MRKLLLATVAALSVIPAVLAQEAIKGVTLENILGVVVKSLCPSGSAFACPFLDFIISFGIVTAIFYMGLNTVEVFSGNASAQRASAIIAILAGLSTAFYIWTQKIAFVALISSFALFFVVLFFLLVIVNFVASRGRHTWSSRLFWLGIILVALGALAIYLRQTNVGPLAMIVGFFLALFGGIWAAIRHLEGAGGGGGGAFAGPAPTPTPGLGAPPGYPAAAAGLMAPAVAQAAVVDEKTMVKELNALLNRLQHDVGLIKELEKLISLPTPQKVKIKEFLRFVRKFGQETRREFKLIGRVLAGVNELQKLGHPAPYGYSKIKQMEVDEAYLEKNIRELIAYANGKLVLTLQQVQGILNSMLAYYQNEQAVAKYLEAYLQSI
jgi:hypothetical protein